MHCERSLPSSGTLTLTVCFFVLFFAHAQAKIDAEAEALAQTPFGQSLLSVIGYVYTEQAMLHLGFEVQCL